MLQLSNKWKQIPYHNVPHLRDLVRKLESQVAEINSGIPSMDFAKFEIDFLAIVSPLDTSLVVGFLTLLAVMGILGPILRLASNVLITLLKQINAKFRYTLGTALLFCVSAFLTIVKMIKVPTEIVANMVYEPLYHELLKPIYSHPRIKRSTHKWANLKIKSYKIVRVAFLELNNSYNNFRFVKAS